MLRRNIKKEIVIPPLSIPAIEQRARQLRAEEMQRIRGLVSARLRQYGHLLGATALSGLVAIGESLRPLLSWNPQARASRTDAGVRTETVVRPFDGLATHRERYRV